MMSFPAEALNTILHELHQHQISQSNQWISEFPNDLDILRLCLSRTNPVKYTFVNGFLPVYSYPAIIILATQKNKISGPVTKSLVG
jgi:hypothetical protein